ncbi:MAG: hypothetical protein HC910_10745 [Spirulinaceae cyanobacterium SM2_1_0]|nr:hypothetical protein [Spirulinaceae cyanobacterium SM2_1_0]
MTDQTNNPQTAQTITASLEAASECLGTALYEWIEQSTETLGAIAMPIATNPVINLATKVPGLSWLVAALGQVNVEAVQKDVTTLQRAHLAASAPELAQYVINEAAWRAAGIGFATNFVPPLALMLLAVDLGAIAALQAEMIYRIATIYGFSPTAPDRRGEVLAIWGLSTGSSSVLKAGLSLVELLPLVGTVAGTTGNAAILYGLGQVACRFYEAKRRAMGVRQSPVVT